MPLASTFTNSLLGRAEQQRNLQRPGMLPGMLGTQAMAGAMQGGGPQTLGSLGAGFDERRGLSSSGGMLPAFMANGGPAETTGIGPLYMQGGGDIQIASLDPTRTVSPNDPGTISSWVPFPALENSEIDEPDPRIFVPGFEDMPPHGVRLPGRLSSDDSVIYDAKGFLDLLHGPSNEQPSVPDETPGLTEYRFGKGVSPGTLSQTPETILGWKNPGWLYGMPDPGLGGSAATATPGGAQDTTGIGAGTYTQEGGATTTAPGDLTTSDIVSGIGGLGLSAVDFLGGLGDTFSGISFPIGLGAGIFNVLRTGDPRDALPWKLGHLVAKMYGRDSGTEPSPGWDRDDFANALARNPGLRTAYPPGSNPNRPAGFDDPSGGDDDGGLGDAYDAGDWSSYDIGWAGGGLVKRQGYANGGPAFREGGLATLL
jgi:hypothetical protein